MDVYKPGGLSSLFMSADDTMKDFFQSRVVEVEEPKKNPDVISAPVPAETEVAQKTNDKSGKTRKRKRGVDDDDDDDNDKPKYAGHSRKYNVRHEDKKERKLDPEQEARTVFVGNLPSTVSLKQIKTLFKEIGEVETVRLRSAARPDDLTTKKLAVIKKKFLETRSNINAYVRFKEVEDAKKSCDLNGSKFQDHVLRVDQADKASKDQSKAVFLGNLSYKVEEDDVREHFAKCGGIVDVRLVRDSSSGVGKGFGYVNFQHSDSIELALKLNGTSLAGREIRVARSSNNRKKASSKGPKVINRKKASSKGPKVNNPKFVKRTDEKRLPVKKSGDKKALTVKVKKGQVVKPKKSQGAKARLKISGATSYQGTIGIKGQKVRKQPKKEGRGKANKSTKKLKQK